MAPLSDSKNGITRAMNTIPFKMWAWSCCDSRPSALAASLADVVTRFGSTACEVEHDKIYSLMGLALEGWKIAADYRCSIPQLFCRVFSPMKPGHLDFDSLSIIAWELQLRNHDLSSLRSDLNIIECRFQSSDIDQVTKVASKETSDQLATFVSTLPYPWHLHTSYFKSNFRPTTSDNPFLHNDTLVDDSVEFLDEWMVYMTMKGYVICCPPKTRTGDLICPITCATALIVQRQLDRWSIIGMGYGFFPDPKTGKLSQSVEQHSYPRDTRPLIPKPIAVRQFHIGSDGFSSQDFAAKAVRDQVPVKMGKNGKSLPSLVGHFVYSLRGETLVNMTLEDRRFKDGTFCYCVVQNCVFEDCVFSLCEFRKCKFKGCSFSKCTFLVHNEFFENNQMDLELGGKACGDSIPQGQLAKQAISNGDEIFILYLEMTEAMQLSSMFP